MAAAMRSSLLTLGQRFFGSPPAASAKAKEAAMQDRQGRRSKKAKHRCPSMARISLPVQRP
eukprot:4369724-Pyramimonas_sp.AAC.1